MSADGYYCLRECPSNVIAPRAICCAKCVRAGACILACPLAKEREPEDCGLRLRDDETRLDALRRIRKTIEAHIKEGEDTLARLRREWRLRRGRRQRCIT